MLIKGGGDIGSGAAWRLHRCGFKVLITEINQPLAVRRRVAFSEAIYDGEAIVEGVKALRIGTLQDVDRLWRQGKIPVLVDPECSSRHALQPDVIVDAIMAKKNTGTCKHDAPLVIALGPGFEAGQTTTFVVETNRLWLRPRQAQQTNRGYESSAAQARNAARSSSVRLCQSARTSSG